MERDEARRRFDARVDIECRHRPSNARSRRRTKRRRGASSGGRERPNVTRPHASRASRVTRRGHGVSFGYSPCPSTLPRVGTRDGECFLTTTFRPRKTLKTKCTDCLLSQNRVAFGNQAEHLDGWTCANKHPASFRNALRNFGPGSAIFDPDEKRRFPSPPSPISDAQSGFSREMVFLISHLAR